MSLFKRRRLNRLDPPTPTQTILVQVREKIDDVQTLIDTLGKRANELEADKRKREAADARA